MTTYTTDTALDTQRLIQARKAAGLRRSDLARLLGYAAGSISIRNWETGYSEPSTYNLKRLCRALDVSADWLLGLED